MRYWLLVGLIGAIAVPAQAQRRLPASLAPGVRIRYAQLWEPKVKRTGTIEGLLPDTLIVRGGEDSVVAPIPILSLSSIDVSGGVRSSGSGAGRGAWRGFLVGAALSTALVAAVALSSADENCSDCFFPPTGAAVVVGGLGTLLLTGFGALIGAAAPGEEWIPLSLPLGRGADGGAGRR